MFEKQVGPFMGVDLDQTVKFGKRRFRVIAYRAYNAFGLIGPEKNGIAILDEVEKAVVTDEIARQVSGYHGLSGAQRTKFDAIVQMSWSEFKDLVNTSPRARFHLK